ncbi:unnamed protein product [Peronospora belbahrii]|uniref:Uncharacterized protein n=1 Tax=Peronospora belbahrii TaxID=622444 RepID=A0AAU9L8D9_9STRA|nr:unnamed protein product [Peronospora belbahrii]
MARSLGSSVRLRWLLIFLAAVIIIVLSDFLFTWQQLTTSFSPLSFPSIRSRFNVPATYDALPRANDTFNVHVFAFFYVTRVLQIKVENEEDTMRMKTEQLKAGEMEVMKQENRIENLEMLLLHSLYHLTQNTIEMRGIVLPLHDGFASLGLSLVMELRSLGVMLPVEIPHCGDLNQKLVATIEKKRKQLGSIYVYDVCALAAKEKSLLDDSKPIFCKDLDECHHKFRTPMPLWETDKYQTTGTLFFNDRISQTNTSLGYRPASHPNVTDFRHYLFDADVSVFRQLSTIPRNKTTVVSDDICPLNRATFC